MSERKTLWLGAALGLAVVVGLPVAASLVRRAAPAGCALDGARIDPAYRVEVVDGDGRSYGFCCPVCARLWLEYRTNPPRSVTVTDEAGGGPVAAADAWYVRSSVVTVPTTGNRIHAFRDRADAERHAAAFGGRLLPAAEGPFPPAARRNDGR